DPGAAHPDRLRERGPRLRRGGGGRERARDRDHRHAHALAGLSGRGPGRPLRRAHGGAARPSRAPPGRGLGATAPARLRTRARLAGVSKDAVALVRSAEVIDLHLETFIPPRLFGYDLFRRHDRHWLRGRFFGHLDFPRALDGGLTGAMWSIATNVLRTRRGRWRALKENMRALRAE